MINIIVVIIVITTIVIIMMVLMLLLWDWPYCETGLSCGVYARSASGCSAGSWKHMGHACLCVWLYGYRVR